MIEALYNKWNSKIVTGEVRAPKPNIPNFYNAKQAVELLHKHISNGSKIAVHCDVDMDGIGSGYIFKRFMSNITFNNQLYIINKEKVHGIHEKHLEYFKSNPIDLLIILDSSSNSLDLIKSMPCDVLVVDHHEVDHTEYSGYTINYNKFIIVNNMIDNDNYRADSRMSCGLVIYELLRLYQETYRLGPLLENMMLYQWVGVTLFTDAIQLVPDRNQWYIENTVHSLETEPTLMTIITKLNKYAFSLDKNIIGYTVAPTFNRAIRAGATAAALAVVLDQPYNVEYLSSFREAQDWAISTGIQDVNIFDSFVTKSLNNTGILPSYAGVIAGKLCDEHNKNCVVYSVHDNIASGSFRGRLSNTDYRSVFNNFGHEAIAQGHKGAFGFKVPIEHLNTIMSKLVDVEIKIDTRPYLTAGNIPIHMRGQYHISNMDEFKKQGGIMMLSMGNSKVSSDEQIVITVMSNEATLVETRGKLFYYDVLGLRCKAFKEIQPGMINIYIEHSRVIEFFIK